MAESWCHQQDMCSTRDLVQHSRLYAGAVVGNSKFGEVVLATGLFSGHVYYVEKLVQAGYTA